ncbi:Smr/MutS family protein [Erythrobacter donghaensis]|uniref:Smr/MutS family protein n=1 Tax=Erythrobacter donghaensis TaxID=267135 RepID=UPI000A395CAF|nr:Smr/MutS family protein [Erythrobacter donghaensis]
MKAPRGLTAGEQTAWAHLASSVKPLPGKKRPAPPALAKAGIAEPAKATPAPPGKFVKPAKPAPRPLIAKPPAAPPPPRAPGLDSHWDRRMKAGRLEPDLTLDLHGHTLNTAYDRIMTALDQARAMQARVVLVVAGRERPVDPADRMAKRGAIRAKLLDWLAASRHADAITAVRRAHIRHGGEGALYLILKRRG